MSKDLKDIDKQIELIQKSTRVTFKSKTLAWLHNDLRRIFKFYYKWHLKPYSGKVHIGVLIIYTLSIIFGSFNFLLIDTRYTKAADNTYYVAKNGNDTTGDGSIGNPWLTIQKAADTVTAGNTVLVRAGIYDRSIISNKTGTTDSLITFKAYPGEKPVVKTFTVSSSHYVVIDSFEVWEWYNGGGNEM